MITKHLCILCARSTTTFIEAVGITKPQLVIDFDGAVMRKFIDSDPDVTWRWYEVIPGRLICAPSEENARNCLEAGGYAVSIRYVESRYGKLTLEN